MTEGKGPVNICANHVLEEDGDDDEDDDEEIEEDEEMAEVEAEVSHLSISQTQSPRNPENTNFQNRSKIPGGPVSEFLLFWDLCVRVVQTQAIFIFEISVGKRRTRHGTTLDLNDFVFNGFGVDLEIHHSISESFYVGSASFQN